VLVPPSTVPTEADRAAAAAAVPAAQCWDCGGSLQLTVRPNRVVEAVCEDCETVTRLSVAPPAPTEERPRPSFRKEFDAGERRPRRDDDRGDRPPARPCRQCGATLQFTQLPDGTVEGSCPSCGNRFTMRPREDRPSRPSYGRRPGGYGGGSRRPSYGPPRRRSFRDERSDDDEDRPRRRRRDDD
jgi:DNA-directed RNA polymerase subunit RPC12/RpoP